MKIQPKELVEKVVAVLEDSKAKDIRVINLHAVSSVTDFFVIASGSTDRQVRAFSERLSLFLKENGIPSFTVEGKEKGDWIIVDLFDVMVHLFREEVRDHYQLEEFWEEQIQKKKKKKEKQKEDKSEGEIGEKLLFEEKPD